nr:protein IN2-1-like [Setaria viridis]
MATSAAAPAARLYMGYFCPFSQRAWVTRNFKVLQEEIKLVAIHVQDKPAWYKEKLDPKGTVPSLEHNNEIRAESLDLIKYIDSNFGGPALLPQDPAKRQFADELIAFADTFTKALYSPLMSHVEMSEEAAAALDKIEAALSKFNDGPFFLGKFSLADISYVKILERVQIYYSHVRNYDITEGRPNLEKFIEEMNKIEAYTQTKYEPMFLLDLAKKHLKIA